MRPEADLLDRGGMYGLLACAFVVPRPGAGEELRGRWAALAPALPALLDDADDTGGTGAAIAEALRTLTDADLQAAHLRCFGHTISKDCPPYETEYGQAHVFQKTGQLADIAGFYRAFGLVRAPGLHDRLDALAVELEFLQFLCLKEAYGAAHDHDDEQLRRCRSAREKFLGEHLGTWVFAFTRRLEHARAHTVYAVLARLLAAFVTAELARAGLTPAEVAGPDVLSEGSATPECGGCPAAAAPVQENDACSSPS